MTPEIKNRIDQIRRGQVPEGYRKTQFGILPIGWKIITIKNCIEEYNRLSNDIDSIPVYSSSRNGLILQSEYYDQKAASKTNIGYKVVPPGYATYRHMSDDNIFHFNINNTSMEVLVSSEYPVFTSSDQAVLGFLISVLNETDRFRYFCRTQKLGGTRTRLYLSNLQKYRFGVPLIREQQKIAEILATQDKIIELKGELIAEKQRQKKYLMQQLLTGRKRLAGYSKKWYAVKLKSIAKKEKLKNTDFTYSLVLSNSAQHGIIPQEEQFDKEIASTDRIDEYYIVKNGYFVYNPRISTTAPCGPININETGNTGVMSPLYTVFSIDCDYIDNSYMKQYFKSTCWFRHMKSVANYGARHDRMSITDDDFFAMPIAVPELEEQQAISAVFAVADKEISLLQQSLEQEKQKKKALMQLLLTGIVRVSL
ncbi:MAG: hypothetical protein HDT14_01960 [Oscillibacter sp.]|nr:hypothetical protein [Oscillibacter sp.]